MEITESILTSIKKMLGISAEDKHFDPDVMMHINSVLSIMNQFGVGPAEGFSITGDGETWSQFITSPKIFAMAKSYTYLKVKLLFDPPLSTAVIESINRQINELEWRLTSAADLATSSGEEET
jgi:hypothetical protein